MTNQSSSPTVDSTAEVVVSTGLGYKTPICIRQKIDSIQQTPVWNPPAEIHEYEYNGQKVFVMSAPCCDFFNTAVDENCNYLCAPSGGYTGKGDGKCADFIAIAKHIRLVWKDERRRK